MGHIKAHRENGHYVLMKRTKDKAFRNRFLFWGYLYNVNPYLVLVVSGEKCPEGVFPNFHQFKQYLLEKKEITVEVV